ncbi:hypothetical protein BHE74_00026588 [Ensete ventricosum]|nr:hypothetical protein BHE74_00026588 [Ensete ventricosum]
MKDLCGTRVCPDDEGYYVLQMSDWALKDPNAAMQARWLNLSYTAKVWDDSQAASEFGRGGPRCGAIGDPHGEPDIHLEAEVAKLKLEGDPEQLIAARQQVDELQADNAKLKSGLDELARYSRAKSDHRKADDELLRLLRENETLKIELPSKSIANNKQSIEFKWGLQRMGQVFYEYGYRVALARFHDRYPDLEVDNDPFTEKPEDNLVPMETRQEYDVFIPPEE